MRSRKFCQAILTLLLGGVTILQAQSWKDVLNRKGPVRYNDVVKSFEKERSVREEDEDATEEYTEESEKEFEEKDHLFYKWSLFNQRRLDSDGHVTNTLWRTLQAEMSQQQSIQAEGGVPHGNWESIGPTQINSTIPSPANAGSGIGRINSITFNGVDMYLGSASGGAWKGTGAGTWQCLTENIPNLSVSSVCVNPLNPQIIYILTGDGDGYWNGPSNPSIGIIKSTDGGLSWTTTSVLWSTDTSSIAGFKMIMHPSNPETLYVATSEGIYSTYDGWNTYSVFPGFFTDIEFKPGSPSFMYACTLTDFYITTTGGAGGWTQMTEPVITQPDARLAIAVSANRPGWVYVLAGTNSAPFFTGLWLSTNSGVSFGPAKSSMSPCIFCDNSNTYSQATYDIAFTANPADAKEIWMGGIKVWSSLDSGKTWTQRSSYYNVGFDLMHPDIHALEYNAAGELWCGNDGGIFIYTPGGITKWSEQFEGLNIAQYYGMGLDATPPYTSNLFGAQDNGIQRYDGDANNENINYGDGGLAAVDYVSDQLYYNVNSKFFKDCWPIPCDKTPVAAGCNCIDTAYNKEAGVNPYRPIVIDPIDHNKIYHGLNCLWVSTDAADNFSRVTGFPCTDGLISDLDVTSVSKWAVKWNKVYRETAAGVWTDVTGLLTSYGQTLWHIAANTTHPLEAYVCLGGYDATSKVFYTIDGGTNWLNISAGLPNTPVNDIIYQNGSNGGYYAATDIGVYYINNFMFSWIPFRTGMPSVVVTELEINYGENRIYASTFGRGSWGSDLINTCPATDETSLYPSLPSYSTIQASNTVTANSVFNHGFGQNVTLLSAFEVNLIPGFEASNGSEITASIQNCFALKPALNEFSGNFIPTPRNIAKNESVKHHTFSAITISPNPANNYSILDVALSESSDITIDVYDQMGTKVIDVAKLKNQLQGIYRFNLDLLKLKSGVYFIRIQQSTGSHTEKLVVTR